MAVARWHPRRRQEVELHAGCGNARSSVRNEHPSSNPPNDESTSVKDDNDELLIVMMKKQRRGEGVAANE